MIQIAQQTIDYYFKHNKKPTINDLQMTPSEYKEKKWRIFVTLYKNWEIRGASWNIQEIENTLADEIIENTIQALSQDQRFDPVRSDEAKNIKIRIDYITKREPLQSAEYKKIDPVKSGIIAIQRDYNSLACVLPNINPKLLTWEDFAKILEEKLKIHPFKEENYILYKIETYIETNY